MLDEVRNHRLLALTLIGLIALNYPLLSLFAHGSLLFGIPLLYLYLFTAWGVFIVFTARIMRDSHANDSLSKYDNSQRHH